MSHKINCHPTDSFSETDGNVTTDEQLEFDEASNQSSEETRKTK